MFNKSKYWQRKLFTFRQKLPYSFGIFLIIAGLLSGVIGLYFGYLANNESNTALNNQYWLYYMHNENYDLLPEYVAEREQGIVLHSNMASYYQNVGAYANSFASLSIGVGAILISFFPSKNKLEARTIPKRISFKKYRYKRKRYIR